MLKSAHYMFHSVNSVGMGTLCLNQYIVWNGYILFELRHCIKMGTLCFNWDTVLRWVHYVSIETLCCNGYVQFQSIHFVEMGTLCFIKILCWNVYICLSRCIFGMGTLCFNQYIALKLVHYVSIMFQLIFLCSLLLYTHKINIEDAGLPISPLQPHKSQIYTSIMSWYEYSE